MIPEIAPFHAILLSRRAHQLAAEGRSIIHMEFGQPSTGAPAAAIARAHRLLDTDPMGYWDSPELKARIARHYADRYGVAVSPNRITLTCGASPALVLALNTVFAPGARVAIGRPGYVAYRNTLKALHLTPVEIDCGPEDRFQLTAAALAALDPAPDGVIISSPANPTGTIIARDELRAIVSLCEARGIQIVSDEIYHGIDYGEVAASLLEYAPSALIINSFSKYFSMAGWRLGWLVVPEALAEAADARMGNMFLMPPSMSQHAGLIAFDCTDELDGHVATYARNRDLLLEAVSEMGLAKIAPPDGAFYIYADIGHLTDNSIDFCLRLLNETGVATAPGVDFDPENGHRFIRFSFAISTDLTREAIARLVPWFQSQPTMSDLI